HAERMEVHVEHGLSFLTVVRLHRADAHAFLDRGRREAAGLCFRADRLLVVGKLLLVGADVLDALDIGAQHLAADGVLAHAHRFAPCWEISVTTPSSPSPPSALPGIRWACDRRDRR